MILYISIPWAILLWVFGCPGSGCQSEEKKQNVPDISVATLTGARGNRMPCLPWSVWLQNLSYWLYHQVLLMCTVDLRTLLPLTSVPHYVWAHEETMKKNAGGWETIPSALGNLPCMQIYICLCHLLLQVSLWESHAWHVNFKYKHSQGAHTYRAKPHRGRIHSLSCCSFSCLDLMSG